MKSQQPPTATAAPNIVNKQMNNLLNRPPYWARRAGNEEQACDQDGENHECENKHRE